MRPFRSCPIPALVLCFPLVAACGGDDGDDENAMTQGDDAPAVDMASEDDGADDLGVEEASDDDAPVPDDPAGSPTNTDPATDPANPATPMSSAAVDDLILDVCERGTECTGESTEDCLAEGAEGVGLLAALCPELLLPFLECAAESPTCDPEVDCAAEGMALQSCGAEPVVDEITIQMACEVYASCEGEDAVACVEELAAAGGALAQLCPGAFAPYIECVAAMMGCEPEVECAEEMAVLDECTGVMP